MIFLAGGVLWLLSLSILVVAIYFLKRQARLAPVSALFLWRGIERAPKSALRLRWTHLLGLLLQLLALGALITGLAQPVIHTPARSSLTLAIVIDGSASMRYPIEGSTRYEAARETALQLMKVHPAAAISVVQAQAHSVLLSPLTLDHAQVERTLSQSEPSYHGDAQLHQLISLLQSQSPHGFDRVVYLTDHPPAFDAELLGWETHIVASPSRMDNVALTRFAVREHPNGSGYGLYLQAWNSGDLPRQARLVIMADGNVTDARTLELPPRQALALTFSHARAVPSARFEARLVTDGSWEDWPDDNIRYASPPQPRPWKILWIGESNFYLERFLRLSGQANLSIRPSWDEAIAAPEFDLILWHHAAPPRPMSGRFLLLQEGWPPWVDSGQIIFPADHDVKAGSNHPLLLGLDPEDWRLLNVREARVDPRGEVLLSLGQIPLLYLYETTGLRLAYLGIDLAASNLALSVDFPILMYRLLSWLAPRANEQRTLEIGQELPLLNLTEAAQIRVTSPNGRSCEFPSADEHCGLVNQPGFYEVTQGGITQVYAANPPSQEAQQIALPPTAMRPESPTPAISELSLSAPSTEGSITRPLWPYLLVLGIFLLAIELFYFDRSALAPTTLRGRNRQSS